VILQIDLVDAISDTGDALYSAVYGVKQCFFRSLNQN
jgi:hypothetical protein